MMRGTSGRRQQGQVKTKRGGKKKPRRCWYFTQQMPAVTTPVAPAAPQKQAPRQRQQPRPVEEVDRCHEGIAEAEEDSGTDSSTTDEQAEACALDNGSDVSLDAVLRAKRGERLAQLPLSSPAAARARAETGVCDLCGRRSASGDRLGLHHLIPKLQLKARCPWPWHALTGARQNRSGCDKRENARTPC
eukprot:TRINITY_DN3842_c1_g1_i1.p1 TRINITY_DN3842_c1_g1~~TRINITY_DN3842_c1_g1_i1.p1  ORF type:complete len:189 (-),score=45.23 TRINITY_DN3842_c1_g1_i1:201-767(-)